MSVYPRLVLLCIFLLAGGGAEASQQDELDNLRRRIAALQQELEKTSESKSGAADALKESERAISDSNRKLADLARQQHEAGVTLAQLQQQARQTVIDKFAEDVIAAQHIELYNQLVKGGDDVSA